MGAIKFGTKELKQNLDAYLLPVETKVTLLYFCTMVLIMFRYVYLAAGPGQTERN